MTSTVNTTELSRMTAQELSQEIASNRLEYAKMRMDIELQTEKNHARFRQKRRDIARMSTALTMMNKKQGKQMSEGKQGKKGKAEFASQDVQKTLESRGSSKAK
jgi:ribosomal protein L29